MEQVPIAKPKTIEVIRNKKIEENVKMSQILNQKVPLSERFIKKLSILDERIDFNWILDVNDNELQPIPIPPLDEIKGQISELYYHRVLKRLFIGTFEKGIFAYDLPTRQILHSETDLSDVNITIKIKTAVLKRYKQRSYAADA